MCMAALKCEPLRSAPHSDKGVAPFGDMSLDGFTCGGEQRGHAERNEIPDRAKRFHSFLRGRLVAGPRCDRMEPRSRFLAGLFLLAFSGLMFEVLLTRVFSSLFWYHYAFVAISSALLGWGLGAYALTFFRRREALLAAFSTLCSVAILAFLASVLTLPAGQDRLPAFFLASIFPFLFGGMAMAAAFDAYGEQPGKLYFFDLAGAALGALSVPVLLIALNPESMLLLNAVAPLGAALCFQPKKARWRPALLLLALAVLSLAAANAATGALSLPIGADKALSAALAQNPDLTITATDWNAFSRVDLVEGYPPDFLGGLYIDTFAWTFIIPWDEHGMNYTQEWFRALPFRAKPAPKALIIGTGGGTDIALALASGSRDVTAVEINPSIVRFVRGFGDRTGDLYNRPDVHLHVDEGRNFVSRSRDQYDMILLGFVDSSSAIISGGLVISENYLYTVEAFTDYLGHLRDDGVLAFVRYEIDTPRLAGIAKEALRQAGVTRNLDTHLMAIALTDPAHVEPFLGNQLVFMVKKTPFTAGETTRMEQIAAAKGLDPVIFPGRTREPYTSYLADKLLQAEFSASFDVLVHPVTDDNPFYFAYYKPFGIPPNFLRILLVPAILVLALALFTLLFRRTVVLGPAPFLYFAALGVGFMLVEIPVIQKFILLFGRPVFTFSVILFSLLVCTSLGSLLSSRVRPAALPRLAVGTIIALLAIVAVYLAGLDSLIRLLLPLPLAARMAATFLLLLPLGAALGVPFPAGLRLLKAERGSVPLAWAVNGVASVAGSVGATLLGVFAGFSTALVAALLAYLLAAILMAVKWKAALAAAPPA